MSIDGAGTMVGKIPRKKRLFFIALTFALILLFTGCTLKSNFSSNSALEAGKYGPVLEEISSEILDDAPAAIKKAKDAGLIVQDEGGFEEGYVPSSLAIFNPDNGEVMLSVTLESEIAHPAEFSRKGYAVCMHGNVPIKYSFGRVNGLGLTKSELKVHLAGSPEYLQALQGAMGEWNKIPGIPHFSLSSSEKGSDIKVTVGKTGEYGLRARADGTVTLASAAVKTVPTIYQLIFPDGAKVRINTDGLKGYDLKSVLTHELGHVLGLADNYKDRSALMYWQFAPGETRKPISEEVGALNTIHSKVSVIETECKKHQEYHAQETKPPTTPSNVVCDKPPGAYRDGNMYWTYESKGTFANNKCAYRKTGVLYSSTGKPIKSVPFIGSDSVDIG